MDTPFEKLEPEAREDWRGNYTTQAFVTSLMQERTRLIYDLVELIKSGKDAAGRLPHIGGQLVQVDSFLTLLRTK